MVVVVTDAHGRPVAVLEDDGRTPLPLTKVVSERDYRARGKLEKMFDQFDFVEEVCSEHQRTLSDMADAFGSNGVITLPSLGFEAGRDAPVGCIVCRDASGNIDSTAFGEYGRILALFRVEPDDRNVTCVGQARGASKEGNQGGQAPHTPLSPKCDANPPKNRGDPK
jgi:hypothetical protein